MYELFIRHAVTDELASAGVGSHKGMEDLAQVYFAKGIHTIIEPVEDLSGRIMEVATWAPKIARKLLWDNRAEFSEDHTSNIREYINKCEMELKK